MGTPDKVARLLVAIVIAGLYFTNLISGAAAAILLFLAGTCLLTGLASFCPLYFLFGISTRKKRRVMGMSNLVVIVHTKPKH